eukprot:scaffold1287_cov121-Isochrysis_galbana.AAC.4
MDSVSHVTPSSSEVGGLMIVSRHPLPSREASAAPGRAPGGGDRRARASSRLSVAPRRSAMSNRGLYIHELNKPRRDEPAACTVANIS